MKNTNLSLKKKKIINHEHGSKKKLSKKYDEILSEIKKDIKDKNKTLNVLNKNFKFNFNFQDLKKFQKYKTVVLIGMGGSILGAEAIYNFLKVKIKKKFYFINDLNEEKTNDLKKKENFSKILFIIVSKSGNTIETITNTFTLRIIRKDSKNVIIISEKKDNLLYSLSKKLNLFYIEHKGFIGGRFSVLSEVGMVPAYFMGVKVKKLRSNILDFLKQKNKKLLKNSILRIFNLIKSNKFKNLIFLNYSPQLEKFLYWSQQLIAESLGKKKIGLLPIISNAPKDHHSLLQLYLDGPKDKIFYIFSSKNKFSDKIYINKNFGIKSFLNGKKLSLVKNAQRKAFIKSLTKKNIPFREFKINEINEEALGKLFSIYIIETIFLGKILNINPFDQPAVEEVKIFTKELLT